MASDYLKTAIEYIDSWMETQTALDLQTPGYAVAISVAGKMVYNRSFGYANLDNKEELTNAHLFRIASHSKTFTATAIIQLMEAGKLSIHEPAGKYLPFLNENKDKRVGDITIANILQHASGIERDGKDPSFWRLQRHFPNKEEIIDFFKETPLVIESNTRFKYSNIGYGLLGLIIEEVSGKSYADYMRSKILEPLGLSAIGADYDANNGPYVTGYTAITPSGNQAPISPTIDTKNLASATGFYSNAESLCRFYDAIMPKSGKLLSDTSKRELLRQHWEIMDAPAKRGYGLGFKSEYFDKRRLNGHSGGMPGNCTCTLFDINDRIVVSILSNSHSGIPMTLQKGIWHILDKFKSEYDASSPLLKYSGKFYDVWGTSHFIPLGQKIYVTLPSTTQPFKDCSELEHTNGNIFKIVKETGYGSFGQNAEFFMDGDKVKSVSYAGYPMHTQQDYEAYVEELKQRYNQAT